MKSGLNRLFGLEGIGEEATANDKEEERKELTTSEIKPDRGVRFAVVFNDDAAYSIENGEETTEDTCICLRKEDAEDPEDGEEDETFG
jgi:hypothetical protein